MRKNKYETKAKLCTGFEGLRTIDFLRFLACQLKKTERKNRTTWSNIADRIIFVTQAICVMSWLQLVSCKGKISPL